VPRLHGRPETGCLVFTGAIQSNGYGKAQKGRRGDGTDYTHRIVWRGLMGEIPEGLDLDHLCRNRACVNVAHLEPVTRSTNLKRGVGVGGIRVKKED